MAFLFHPKNVYPFRLTTFTEREKSQEFELLPMVANSESAQELFEYARRGMISDLKEALSNAQPDAYVAYDGSTALLMACKNGHHQACQLLIEHKADLSLRTDEGSTALLLSATTGNHELVSLILSHRKCDVNETNEDGFTPVDIAKYYNHTHIIELLESHGGTYSSPAPPEDTAEFNAGPSEKWGYGVFDQ